MKPDYSFIHAIAIRCALITRGDSSWWMGNPDSVRYCKNFIINRTLKKARKTEEKNERQKRLEEMEKEFFKY